MEDTSLYDVFIDTLKPVNRFKNKVCKTGSLTFDEIEVIKTVLRNPTFQDIKDLFQTCYNLTGSWEQSADDEFYGASVFDLFKAQRFIQEHIKGIMNREKLQLSGEADDKMLMINAAERLRPFSHQLTKMKIAEQFGCKPSEVGRWKHRDVFAILVANKVNGDITKDYHAIK